MMKDRNHYSQQPVATTTMAMSTLATDAIFLLLYVVIHILRTPISQI